MQLTRTTATWSQKADHMPNYSDHMPNYSDLTSGYNGPILIPHSAKRVRDCRQNTPWLCKCYVNVLDVFSFH